MSDRHSSKPGHSIWSSAAGVLNFVDAWDQAMPWKDRAACADSGLPWVLDPRAEALSPRSILLREETCSTCPVRLPCLRFAFDSRIEIVGVWGATATLERRAVLTMQQGLLMGPDGRAAAVADAVEALEVSLPARLEGWRIKAAERTEMLARKRLSKAQAAEREVVTATTVPPAHLCQGCGDRLTWRMRSDAVFCSNACRQASYRLRAAA